MSTNCFYHFAHLKNIGKRHQSTSCYRTAKDVGQTSGSKYSFGRYPEGPEHLPGKEKVIFSKVGSSATWQMNAN